MGLVARSIRLRNPRVNDLDPIAVDCLVEPGAATICIPEHIAIQLSLEELEKREVTTADGKRTTCPYVGPLQITFSRRNCFTGALVIGDSVLLGAISLEDMDLIIHPATQSVCLEPDSPNIPSLLVKSLTDVPIGRGHA